MAKLINKKTKREIKIGDVVTDFRGKPAIVTGFEIPRHTGSEGHIHVKDKPNSHSPFNEHRYYPSVYGAQIVEE